MAGDGARFDRGDLAHRLERILDLRKRTFRAGAPIIHWNLKALHADIVKLTRMLSPELAEVHQSLSRFPDARFDAPLERAMRLAQQSRTRAVGSLLFLN